MQKPTLNLEVGLRKMLDSVAAIDDLLSADEDEQSCWTTLLTIRQLESVRVSQLRLLGEYQRHFSGTHWTVNVVLNRVLEQTHKAGVVTRSTLDNLYRQLQSHETTLSLLLRQQIHALSIETRSLLELEQTVLYRMLDLLILAPGRPESGTTPRVIE